MESNSNTPNQMKKEDDNGRLKAELEKMLEEELEKSPNNINTKKIDSITILLDQLDGIEEDDSFDKNEFAQKYLHEYIKAPQNDKIYSFSSRRMRVASAILVFIVIFALGNYVSVKATNQGILTNVKEKIDVFYFDVIKKDTAESIEYNSFSDIQERSGLLSERYDSWEEVREEIQFDFKIPNYIPKGFIENEIYYQKVGEIDFEISRSYYSGDEYILFYISSFSDTGRISTVVDEVESVLFEKTIGDFYVTSYQIQNDIQAFFQDNKFIYLVETNLNENELEKIIMEIR